MGALRILVVVVVLLLLAPAVICVVPGTTSGTAETDCCQHMSAACGSEHGISECCLIAPTDLAMTAPATKISTIHIQASYAVAPVSNVVLKLPPLYRPLRSDLPSQSPPPHSSDSIDVLRI